MKILVLDLETLYSDEYSLRRMSPAEYILDPRFRANGCAFMDGLDGVPYWIDGDDLHDFFHHVNPSTTMTVSHNALFDNSILAWRFNFVPRLACCTMSIAQATRRYCLKSVSLGEVAKHLRLGFKDGGALTSVKGMDLPAIKAAGLYDRYVEYALHDVSLCSAIFNKLVVETHEFPMCEIPILDMILKMTLQPSFVLDRGRLAHHLHDVQAAKQRTLDAIGSDKTLIRQNETFADMLRAQGVDPPRKISPTTGLELYAFSKTDEEFLELESHPNVIVQALVAARLGAKSTIEETRAQRFINISNLQWPVTIRSNSMPMPVRFSGAHTHRGSGDWKLNVQNMTRGGELRKALRAPPGYKVVTVDASQIEARITAFLAGQEDLLQQFENGDDVYSNFASIIYGFPVNKKDHPAERFVGKTCILGLGFGMGWMKFHRQINLSKQVVIDEKQAENIVATYRNTFSYITSLRAYLNTTIPVLANGDADDLVVVGPVVIKKGVICIPGRLKMFYHELQYKVDNELAGWTFNFAGKPKRLYGGRVLENIVQYLDRIIVFDAAARIQNRFRSLGWGYRLAQQAHDENGYIVKDEHVEPVKAILLEEMTRRPSWGETLPLMAEVGVGDNYGEAK